MARREYFHDPVAPRPNSIVVAANAFVLDGRGQALMVERSDNGLWALPGGGQDFGEFVAEAAERETLEETGYRVRVTGLVGVYSDPHHVMAYDDGEVRQQFALVFRAQLLGGVQQVSDETPRLRWVARTELSDIEMHPSIRLRVDHGFEERSQPYIG